METEQLRLTAINEMFRVCKPGGKIFILVWAFEQPEESKRKFTKSDELVPWICREDGQTYYRFYHVYKKNELLDEFNKSNYIFDLTEEIYEHGNWGIICTKF